MGKSKNRGTNITSLVMPPVVLEIPKKEVDIKVIGHVHLGPGVVIPIRTFEVTEIRCCICTQHHGKESIRQCEFCDKYYCDPWVIEGNYYRDPCVIECRNHYRGHKRTCETCKVSPVAYCSVLFKYWECETCDKVVCDSCKTKWHPKTHTLYPYKNEK